MNQRGVNSPILSHLPLTFVLSGAVLIGTVGAIMAENYAQSDPDSYV